MLSGVKPIESNHLIKKEPILKHIVFVCKLFKCEEALPSPKQLCHLLKVCDRG